MAHFDIEAGDFLRLRYEALKHFAAVSGGGIAAGLILIEKFSLIQPTLAAIGIVCFAACITVSTLTLVRLVFVDRFHKGLTWFAAVSFLCGVFLLLGSFVSGCVQRYNDDDQPVVVVQDNPPSIVPVPHTEPAPAPQPQLQPQPQVQQHYTFRRNRRWWLRFR